MSDKNLRLQVSLSAIDKVTKPFKSMLASNKMLAASIKATKDHTRSSSQVTSETKERYHQCINVNCGHTFVTLERFMRSISKPGEINPVEPHQQNGGQEVMF